MLRVSVAGGGCSGFQYKFDTERARADDDIVIEKSRRDRSDRPGVAQLHGRVGDRLRRRPDRIVVQGQQSARPPPPAAAARASRFKVRLSRADRRLRVDAPPANGAAPCASPPGTSIRSSNGSTRRSPGSPSGSPTSSACRRRNASTTRFRASRSRRSATMSRSTGRRRSTASRCCRSCRSTKSVSACPATHTDDHARFIEAVVSTANGALRVASIYLPNGNPPDTDKYSYKIGWMKRLSAYARERLTLASRSFSPATTTSFRRRPTRAIPQAWRGDALFLPQTP